MQQVAMNNDVWDSIKKFYGNFFGFPEGLVELAAISDILLMCVSGSSNESISNLFQIDDDEVSKILEENLNFTGWKSELDFNPYIIYVDSVKYGHYNLQDFIKEIQTIDEDTNDELATTMFRICSLYYRLEERINNEWY